MINGKFFAGLTPKMLERNSPGPNRQQSNLFWPDESDYESASEPRSKRNHRTTQQNSGDSNSPYNTDVDTKELFQKQLTSKIGFYDNVEEVTPNKNNIKTSIIQPTFEESPIQKNKIEAFTSKIQFYDYADDVKSNTQKTDKNSKKDVERNSKNSPKTIDKRIKFVDKVPIENEITQPKGILRNNEKSVKDKTSQDLSRKRLIKKRNLSKSVENLSFRSQDFSDDDEDDCIKVIENDVKNVAINDRKIQEDEGRRSSRNEEVVTHRSNRSNIKVDRPQTPVNHENYDDGIDSPEEQIDENFFRKTNRDQTVIYHEIRRDSDHGDSDRGNSARSAASRPPTQHQSGYDNDNFYGLQKSINSQNSPARSQRSDQPPPDQFQQPLNNNRSHRHLQSSIFFGNDTEPSSAERPPKSVRNSAVMRVSVGLPD